MRGGAEVHTINVFTEIVGVLYEVPTDPPEGDLATDVVGKSEDFDEALGNEKVSVLFGALAAAVSEDHFAGLVIAQDLDAAVAEIDASGLAGEAVGVARHFTKAAAPGAFVRLEAPVEFIANGESPGTLTNERPERMV